jgi:hypothetical protein
MLPTNFGSQEEGQRALLEAKTATSADYRSKQSSSPSWDDGPADVQGGEDVPYGNCDDDPDCKHGAESNDSVGLVTLGTMPSFMNDLEANLTLVGTIEDEAKEARFDAAQEDRRRWEEDRLGYSTNLDIEGNKMLKYYPKWAHPADIAELGLDQADYANEAGGDFVAIKLEDVDCSSHGLVFGMLSRGVGEVATGARTFTIYQASIANKCDLRQLWDALLMHVQDLVHFSKRTSRNMEICFTLSDSASNTYNVDVADWHAIFAQSNGPCVVSHGPHALLTLCPPQIIVLANRRRHIQTSVLRRSACDGGWILGGACVLQVSPPVMLRSASYCYYHHQHDQVEADMRVGAVQHFHGPGGSDAMAMGGGCTKPGEKEKLSANMSNASVTTAMRGSSSHFKFQLLHSRPCFFSQ